MGCCLGTVLCCFGQAACSLCCACLPSCKSSTSSRLAYLGIFLVVLILACVFMSPLVGEQLLKIDSLCSTVQPLLTITGQGQTCQDAHSVVSLFIGYPAVYRLCLGLACFFFLLMLIMINVRSSKDLRSKIQNGFWFFKIIILVGFIIGAFFIKDPTFEFAWMIIGAIGGFLFILIQLILIVDFAHGWCSSWLDNYDQTSNKCWFAAILFFTILFYFVFVGIIIVLYIFYAKNSDCQINKFFVSINLIFCVVVSIVSILPKIQEACPQSGLLQSSLISMYVMYLTWSSMANGTNQDCNPQPICVISQSTSCLGNSTSSSSSVASQGYESFSFDVVIPIVILLVCVFYAGFSSSRNTAINKVRGCPEKGESKGDTGPVSEEENRQTVWDDEEEAVAYNYSFFHFMFLLATLFVMMTITHWYKPDATQISLNGSDAAVWVKISASWMCLFIYLWSLVAPLIFKDRIFT